METRIDPDTCKMKKLIRDPKCKPVLRGILESLLQYLTEDLAKKTPRSAEGPDLRKETCVKPKTSNSKFPKSGGAKDPKSRRLTSFQLLQSKFLKSSPKPFISHQREVGTLSSGRGAPHQDEDTKRDGRDRTRRAQGPKRRNSVKEIVAKFAVAERKEQERKTQGTQLKLAQQGILLSSLVETFENVATVRKKSDFKFSNEKLSGGFPSAVREKVARLEGEEQQASDRTVKPLKQRKTTGREPGQDCADNVFTNVNCAEETDPTGREICSLSNQASADLTGIQASNNEAEAPVKTLKNGRQELLSSASVSEWSPPKPPTVLPQEELPLIWNVATIVTCSPVQSRCVDSSIEEHLQKASESPNLDKKTRKTTEEDQETSSRTCSSVFRSPNQDKRTEDPFKESESYSRTCSALQFSSVQHLQEASESPNLHKRAGKIADDPWNVLELSSRTCSPVWSTFVHSSSDKRTENPPQDLESFSRTCSRVQSRCVDTSLEEHLREASESPNLDRRTRKTTGDLCEDLELSSRTCSPVQSRCVYSDKRTKDPPEELESSSRGSAASESFINAPETKVKPSDAAGGEALKLRATDPRGFSVLCQISPSSESEPTHLTTNLQSRHNMTELGTVLKTLEHLQDVGSYNSCYISKPRSTKEKSSEENLSETVEKGKGLENGDFGTPQSFRLSVEHSSNDAFKDRDLSLTQFQPGRDIKQKPKYTTINYGDPSVKQTYKPKIIRFTDTFNF